MPGHHAAASALGIESEAAGLDGGLVPCLLHGVSHLGPVHGHQGKGADMVGVSGSDSFGVSSDLRVRLAPSPDHHHEQGPQAPQKGAPRCMLSEGILIALLLFHGGTLA